MTLPKSYTWKTVKPSVSKSSGLCTAHINFQGKALHPSSSPIPRCPLKTPFLKDMATSTCREIPLHFYAYLFQVLWVSCCLSAHVSHIPRSRYEILTLTSSLHSCNKLSHIIVFFYRILKILVMCEHCLKADKEVFIVVEQNIWNNWSLPNWQNFEVPHTLHKDI